MVDLMVVIGNSGFEYIVRDSGKSDRYVRRIYVDVRNIGTKVIIFTLTNNTGASSPPPVSKNFLGMDNRYYHIYLSGNGKSIQVGQISPSGAVVGADRTIIKQIRFYPVYSEAIDFTPKITSVLAAPPSISTPLPVIPTEPRITSFKEVEQSYTAETTGVSWIEKLINQITNWIKKLLRM